MENELRMQQLPATSGRMRQEILTTIAMVHTQPSRLSTKRSLSSCVNLEPDLIRDACNNSKNDDCHRDRNHNLVRTVTNCDSDFHINSRANFRYNNTTNRNFCGRTSDDNAIVIADVHNNTNNLNNNHRSVSSSNHDRRIVVCENNNNLTNHHHHDHHRQDDPNSRRNFNRNSNDSGGELHQESQLREQECNSSTSSGGGGSTTWPRLGSLIIALLAVTVHSAPTTMSLQSRRLSAPPKWANPCGLAAEDFDGEIDVVQLRDEQLLAQVITQARTALMHAQNFRDDYIKRTFKSNYADLHVNWKNHHYDWLPSPKQIPKQLGEHLNRDYLDKLKLHMLDTALLDAYEYMQRYAVGLEQIVWDQDDHGLEFKKQFRDTEHRLRTVLCELQVALVERNVPPRPDIQREIMSREYRDMSNSATYRNLRDWLIFRDYMNGLEYVVQVFEHLIRGLEDTS